MSPRIKQGIKIAKNTKLKAYTQEIKREELRITQPTQ